MLTRMRLENFKSWEDTGDVAFKPITGLFGKNSSGKTGLIQALLMLKQTAESSDRKAVFNFGDDLAYANLGDFWTVIHKHQRERTLKVSLDWTSAETFQVPDVETDRPILEDRRLGFDVAACGPIIAGNVQVDRMSYRVGDAAFGIRRSSDKIYELFSEGVDLEFTSDSEFLKNIERYLLSPVKCHEFQDDISMYFENAKFLEDLVFELEELLGRLYYVGSIRDAPKRGYSWEGRKPANVGQAGEFAGAALLSAEQLRQRIDTGDGKLRQPLQRYVAHWLKELGLIHEFRVQGSNSAYEVLVQESEESPMVSIADVGFGVSQVFPALVQCFYAPEGSTVILEQPDVHLHPAAQAALADALIDAWKIRKVQIIVESHSEHLLQRLQRRIAEERISQADVGLYFCSSSNGRSELTELVLDEYGNIENWPENFFGDPFGEIAAMSEAVLRRQGCDE